MKKKRWAINPPFFLFSVSVSILFCSIRLSIILSLRSFAAQRRVVVFPLDVAFSGRGLLPWGSQPRRSDINIDTSVSPWQYAPLPSATLSDRNTHQPMLSVLIKTRKPTLTHGLSYYKCLLIKPCRCCQERQRSCGHKASSCCREQDRGTFLGRTRLASLPKSYG